MNIVSTKQHHASGGDGDFDGVRRICIDRHTSGALHGNYLKWTQATSKDDCILWAIVDDDRVGDMPPPDPSVGVGHLRLKVTMKSLIYEGAPRN